MQFLDAIGLAYFWEKIKDWANSRFFSKEGGEINPGQGLRYIINGEQLNVSTPGNENETIDIFTVTENGMEVISIKKTDGTATQVLMADGSVRTLNTSNGIAGLDANGNVPLANLGNLDTTVAEVVTALPTSNIKRHIYLVKDSDTTNNKYAEYVYTGDISAAYDSTKWEKLGDFRATVDLADYAKKSEAIHEVILGTRTDNSINFDINYVNGNKKRLTLSVATTDYCGLMSTSDKIKLSLLDTSKIFNSVDVSKFISAGSQVYATQDFNYIEINIPAVDGKSGLSFRLSAASERAGLMSADDKTKLDGIAPNANNYSLPLAANGTRGGIQVGYAANGRNYPVQLSGEKAYVNVPWTDTNTTYDLSPYAKTADVNTALSKKVDKVSGKGLSTEDFTTALKTKLNGIATGATADSAITTGEIDALFA